VGLEGEKDRQRTPEHVGDPLHEGDGDGTVEMSHVAVLTPVF